MNIIRMTDLALSGKRVMIRLDLNVPIENGEVSSDTRMRATLPTIQQALDDGAAVILLAHLGRPTEGQFEAQFSLAPVARHLGRLLDREIRLERDWLDGVDVAPGQLVLCENVRFNVGEKKNDPQLARKMAALCDIYVMDAFGAAHRAQASTEGVARYAPVACAGPLLARELEVIGGLLTDPERPLVAVVGGAKVAGKLPVLQALGHHVDHLIVGGGIANTFIAAAGKQVGRSLYEPDLLQAARRLSGKGFPAAVPLPEDLVVARELTADAATRTCGIDQVGADEMIGDIGPATANHYAELLGRARTVVWNGPVGVFEIPQFSAGTRRLAQAIADSEAFSVAGGGETLAALEKFGVAERISYISTGGGAFLNLLAGKPLPAVEILRQRAAEAGTQPPG